MITWNEIIQECGNYKAGFVATFRRYEGMETDERDGSNRIVRVTQNGFADHMGIPRETFKRWVRLEVRPELGQTSAREARTAASHANVVKNLARSNPAALVDAIQSAGPQAEDEVYHEHKLRRAGVDTSKAGRKAADAGAHAKTEPIRRAMATGDIALAGEALDDLKEHLETALAAGALDKKAMDFLSPKLDAVLVVFNEARFMVS